MGCFMLAGETKTILSYGFQPILSFDYMNVPSVVRNVMDRRGFKARKCLTLVKSWYKSPETYHMSMCTSTEMPIRLGQLTSLHYWTTLTCLCACAFCNTVIL